MGNRLTNSLHKIAENHNKKSHIAYRKEIARLGKVFFKQVLQKIKYYAKNGQFEIEFFYKKLVDEYDYSEEERIEIISIVTNKLEKLGLKVELQDYSFEVKW